jgi:hypothetical protein
MVKTLAAYGSFMTAGGRFSQAGGQSASNISRWGNPVGITQNGNNVPQNYNLSQNYPNPFNPSTKIDFDIPVSAGVELTLYDISGKEVRNLFTGYLEAGSYKYALNAENLSSGVYFFKLSANNYRSVKKMILTK